MPWPTDPGAQTQSPEELAEIERATAEREAKLRETGYQLRNLNQGAGGAYGDFVAAATDPTTDPAVLQQKAVELEGGIATAQGIEAQRVEEARKRYEANPGLAKDAGYDPNINPVAALRNAQRAGTLPAELMPGSSGPAVTTLPSLAKMAAQGVTNAAIGALPAPRAQAPRPGGFGVGKLEDPIALRSGVDVAALPRPVEYMQQLAADVKAGKRTAAEAKKLTDDYTKWYGSPDGIQARMTSEDMRQKALGAEFATAEGEAQRAEHEGMKSLWDEQAAADEARAKRFAEAQQAFGAQRARDEGAYRRAVDDLDKMKIEPDRWFKGENTWRGIVGGIAMALGAVSSAATGKENLAAKPIMDAIDRDIDAQKANLVAKRAALGERGNLLNVMRQHFSDDIMAESAAKQIAIDAAKAKANSLASGTSSKTAQIGLQRLNEDLEGQKEVARLTFEYAQKVNALEAQRAAAAFAAAAARRRDQPNGGLKMQEFKPELQARAVLRGDPRVGMTGFLAPTPDAAKEAREQLAVQTTINSQVDALKAIGEKKQIIGSDAKLAEQLVTNLGMAYNRYIAKGGAMDEAMQATINKIIKDPSGFVNAVVGNRSELATLDGFRAIVNQTIEQNLQSANILPIATPPGGVTENANGEAVPTFTYLGSASAPQLAPGRTAEGRETKAYGYAPEVDAAIGAAQQQQAPVHFGAGQAPGQAQ